MPDVYGAPDTNLSGQAVEESYPDTPEGWAARWAVEFGAVKPKWEEFHRLGKEATDALLELDHSEENEEYLALFHSNTTTMHSLLYGKVPKASVDRRFADSQDNIGRIGAAILERALNSDLETGSDGAVEAIGQAVLDQLLVDIGMVRLIYVPVFRTEPGKEAQIDPASGETIAEEVPESQSKIDEDVETLYVHWQDVMWSACRVFNEMRWCAFRAPMSRKELVKRFGEEIGREVPLNSKIDRSDKSDAKTSNPWQRADVWEIWNKENRTVYWYVEGYGRVLDQKPDFLNLKDFWPFPKPMVLNTSNSDFFPRPDYKLHKPQYDSIQRLTVRIRELTRAVKVVGLYDKNCGDLQNMFKSPENFLVPTDWAPFAETGGIAGHMQFMDVKQIVEALDKLREMRGEEIQLLFQVSGMSDVLRGESTQQNTTATEQAVKARFASVRVQTRQDRIAEFASKAQAIKAEIASKQYEDQTFLIKANWQYANQADAPLGMAGVQVIKEKFPSYRITVKPDQIALTDFAALKQERNEIIMGLSQYMQSMVPLLQILPEMLPDMLEVLQWAVSGYKGAAEIQGVLDRAIQTAKQSVQQRMMQQAQAAQRPDPKAQAEQVKGQMQAQHTQMELQADIQRKRMEGAIDLQTSKQQAAIDIQKERAKAMIDIAKNIPKLHDNGAE